MSCLWSWWCRRRVHNTDSDSSSGSDEGAKEKRSEKDKKKRRWRKLLKLPWKKAKKGYSEAETALDLEEEIPNPMETLRKEDEEKREQLLNTETPMSDEVEDVAIIQLVTEEYEASDKEVTDQCVPIDQVESELPELHPLEEIQQVTEEDEARDEELIDQWVPIDMEESELPELHPLGDNEDMIMDMDDAGQEEIMAALAIRTVLDGITEDAEMDVEENPQEDFDIFKQPTSDFLDEMECSTVQAYGDDLSNAIDEDSDADAFGQLLSHHLERTGMNSDQSLESQKDTTTIMTATTIKAVMNIFKNDSDGSHEIAKEEDNEEHTWHNVDEDIEVHTEEPTKEDNKDEIGNDEGIEEDIKNDKDEDIEVHTEEPTKEDNSKKMANEIAIREDIEKDKDGPQEKDHEKDSVGMPLDEEEIVEKNIPPVRKNKRRRRGTRGKGRKINYKKDQNGLTGGDT